MSTDTRMSSGLSPAAPLTEFAANDEAIDPATRDPSDAQGSDGEGWDPFEVWRTRVKEARERPAPASTERPQKN